MTNLSVEVTMNPAARQTVLNLMRHASQMDPERQWLRSMPGAFGMVTGVPFPTLNGAWLYQADADPVAVCDVLGAVADEGAPYGLQAVPECVGVGEVVARSVGLTRGPDIPLMTLRDPGPAVLVDGLVMRELRHADFDLRTEVAASAFEVDTAAIRRATALFAPMPGYRMFIGEVDGVPVTTAVTISDTESVGIFDVATPAQFRGHGYGAAITAYATRAGFVGGVSWAWLQSSMEGFGVYERLGFRTVEQWALWLAG